MKWLLKEEIKNKYVRIFHTEKLQSIFTVSTYLIEQKFYNFKYLQLFNIDEQKES